MKTRSLQNSKENKTEKETKIWRITNGGKENKKKQEKKKRPSKIATKIVIEAINVSIGLEIHKPIRINNPLKKTFRKEKGNKN